MYSHAVNRGVLASASSAQHYRERLAGTEAGRKGCQTNAAGLVLAGAHIVLKETDRQENCT